MPRVLRCFPPLLAAVGRVLALTPTSGSSWIPPLVLATALATLCAPGSMLHAQSKTWIGETNGLWSVGSNWSPAGVPDILDSVLVIPTPGIFDTAFVQSDRSVRTLDILNGGDVRVTNSLLNVAGILLPVSAPGVTTISGSNSELLLQGRSASGRTFDTDELHVNSGGLFLLSSNADADIGDALLIGGGTVSGNGQIDLFGNSGVSLTNSGVIAAENGSLSIAAIGTAPLDLDGLGDAGALEAGADSHLLIDGDLTDPFSHAIDIGHTSANNRSELTMHRDWELDSSGVINFDNPGGSSGLGKLNGAKLTTTGTINAQSGIGTLSVDIDANSGAGFNVMTGATLNVLGQTTFNSGSQVNVFNSGKLSMGIQGVSTTFEPGSNLIMQSAEVSIGGPVFMRQSNLVLDSAATTSIGPTGVLFITSNQIDQTDNVFNSEIELRGTLSVNTTDPWTVGSGGLLKMEGAGRLTGSSLELEGGGEITVGAMGPSDNLIFFPLTIRSGSKVRLLNNNAKLTLKEQTILDGGQIVQQSVTGAFVVQEGPLSVIDDAVIAVDVYDWDGPFENGNTFIGRGATLSLAAGRVDSVSDIYQGYIGIDGSTLDVDNLAGMWTFRDGTMELYNLNPARTARVQGEPLFNEGTIIGVGEFNADVTNRGTIAPGRSAGELTFNGRFTQTTDGSVEIEIGGSLSEDYDRIVTTGFADLSGTLNIPSSNTVRLAGSSFTNNGTVTLNNNNINLTANLQYTSNLTLGGTGEVVLISAGGNRARLTVNASDSVLTHRADHTIRGFGFLTGNIVNHGSIEGNSAAEPITVFSQLSDAGPLENVVIDGSIFIANAAAGPHAGAERAGVKVTATTITGPFAATGFAVDDFVVPDDTQNGSVTFNRYGRINSSYNGTFTVDLKMNSAAGSFLNGSAPVPSFTWNLQNNLTTIANDSVAVANGDSLGPNRLGVNNTTTAATILDGNSANNQTVGMALVSEPEQGDAVKSAAKATNTVDVDFSSSTGMYVLQFTCDDDNVPNGFTEEQMQLLVFDTVADDWMLAIDDNFDGGAGGTFFAGSYSSYLAGSGGGSLDSADLSSYGVDAVNNMAWAVLDHASLFSLGVLGTFALDVDLDNDGDIDGADFLAF